MFCARNQVPVGVYRHLNGAVARLFLHVSERGTILNKETSEGMPQVMKPEPAQASGGEAGLEVIVDKIIGIEHRSYLGGEHHIIHGACLALHECFQHPLVPKFQQYPPQLTRQVDTA